MSTLQILTATLGERMLYMYKLKIKRLPNWYVFSHSEHDANLFSITIMR